MKAKVVWDDQYGAWAVVNCLGVIVELYQFRQEAEEFLADPENAEELA